MGILIMFFFAYRNYKLAESLSESGFRWAITTCFVWFLMELLGFFIFLSFTMVDTNTIQDIQSPENREYALFLLIFGPACGYLGYLLVNRSIRNSVSNEEEFYDEDN